MNISSLEEKARFVEFWVETDHVFVKTESGKILKRHKSISKRLENATKKQLSVFEILGNGEGVHWPLLDEDLSAAFLIYPEKFASLLKRTG